MPLLESIGRTAWTTCERCGNTYSGGGQPCTRCGNPPTVMQRLANFSYPPSGKRNGSRGVLRRTRTRGTYPGLAETALLSDRASKRRAARMALLCAIGASALVIYALAQPYLAGLGFLHSRTNESHVTATGPVVQSGPVVSASGNSVSPAQQPPDNAPAQPPNVSAFHQALQRGNLAAARRYLAAISASDKDTSQLQQMRTELATREHARDALLHHAWHCHAIGDWQCVNDNASQALAIDASNWEAKHLVARATKQIDKASG
jgi:hypothetical protein